VVLHDLYPKGTMKVFRAHGIGHYELEIVNPKAPGKKRERK
jgi:hypothetical protein